MNRSKKKQPVEAAPTRNPQRRLDKSELCPGLWLREAVHRNYYGVWYYHIEQVEKHYVEYSYYMSLDSPPRKMKVEIEWFLSKFYEIVDGLSPEKEEEFRQEDFKELVLKHSIACEKVREIEAELTRERIRFEPFTATRVAVE